jgi:Protease subunit of ATP-dependent Clp proteases
MLTGEISKESADSVIRQLLVLDSESSDPVTLYINSPGGDVDAGFAIYDTVRFISSPVTVVGIGLVASAAALVFLSVDKERRLAFPHSSYLIHQPLSGMKGVEADIAIHAEQLSRLKVLLNRIIADATGKSLEEVSRDTERDYWLSSLEAIDYGIVGRIVKSKSEI